MFFPTLVLMIGMHILLSSRFLLKFYIFFKKIFEAAREPHKHSNYYMNLSNIRQKKFYTFDDLARHYPQRCLFYFHALYCLYYSYCYACTSPAYDVHPTEAVEMLCALYYKKKQPASYTKNG